MPKILLYILVLTFFSLKAQNKVELKLHFVQNESLDKSIKIKSQYSNLKKAESEVENIIQKLFSKGFIEASVDSTVLKDKILHSYIYIGKQYLISTLENGNLNEELVRKIHFRPKEYINKKLAFSEIEKTQNEIVSFYENRGYPFAEVYLDSFSILNNRINAKIFVNPHSLFMIDTIIVEGNTNTTSKYLQNFLSIKKGDYYDKSKIDKISQKISQLSFIKESRKSQLVFLAGKIKMYIFIEKQKSNEFNLLLGILPNDKLNKNKITITGDGTLHLFNSFGVGEEMFVDFKQLKPQTQNLDIAFVYPYLLNLPFGINGKFNLYKNDTSFLNINTKVGISYPFNGVDYIQVFYQNKISNVLNYDTSTIRATKQLPETLDKVNNNFGVKMHFQKLDYIFNPRKGFDFTISGAVGTRKIKPNSILTNIESTVYDNIQTESIIFNSTVDLRYFIPILKRHSILLANKSEFLLAKNVLKNEKYRIGGSHVLRGFDEEEIYSPYFSVFTTEYHFSLSKNAYFYAFGDFAIVEDSRNNNKIDIPFGFGVGTTFETKAGIFSLSYALGKQLDNKIELKNGKIHFGYINLF